MCLLAIGPSLPFPCTPCLLWCIHVLDRPVWSTLMYLNQYIRPYRGRNLIALFLGFQPTGCTASHNTYMRSVSYTRNVYVYANDMSHLLRESICLIWRYWSITAALTGRRTTRPVLHTGWMDLHHMWFRHSSYLLSMHTVLRLVLNAVQAACSTCAFLLFSHPFPYHSMVTAARISIC